MIIKRTIRYASYMLAFFGLAAAQACGDDEKKEDLCYKCTYDGDSETLCYEDFKDDMDKDEFEDLIDYLGDYMDCDKQ